MTDTKIADNIFKNSASNTMDWKSGLDHAKDGYFRIKSMMFDAF